MKDPNYYPKCWDDDVRMSVLFGEVRNRNVNPQDWNDKLSFWSKSIKEWSVKTQTWTFHPQQAIHAFQRKGRTPVSMKTVIDAMVRDKSLITQSTFEQNLSDSWTSWGYNTLVKTPISWLWSSASQVLYGPPEPMQLDEPLVCMDVVKDKSQQVLTRLQENVENPVTGLSIKQERLWNLCSDIVGTEENLITAMRFLRQQGRMVWKKEGSDTIVKFSGVDQNTCSPITEADIGIVRLETLHKNLETSINKMNEGMLRLKADAKKCLETGNRLQAKSVLKKKKLMEAEIEKKQVTLNNVELLLGNLQSVDTDKMVLEAYKIGVASFKRTMAENGLDVDKVDDTMAEVQEVMETHDEIQQIIAAPVVPADDTTELEDELEQIMRADKTRSRRRSPSPAAAKKMATQQSNGLPNLPDVPRESPGKTSPGKVQYPPRELQKELEEPW